MIVNKDIQAYSESHTTAVDNFLQTVERLTFLQTLQPHMVSGGFQGKFLEFISKLTKPKTILEVGTFTGFSALCLAKGLSSNGILHTIDVNEELMEKTKKTFHESPYRDQIHVHVGNAMDIIPKVETSFDLVFIDGDKANYKAYYELLVEKVPSGGVILIDNVLWKGKVTNAEKDKKTQAIHVLNETVQNDDRVENILLPIRDGLLWIVKK